MKNEAVNQAVRQTSAYIYREMELAEIRIQIQLLEKKRAHHIRLLGKTVYRLSLNGVEPFSHQQVTTIASVIDEIDTEIASASSELERRKQQHAAQPTQNPQH
jgi:hypothetical protein